MIVPADYPELSRLTWNRDPKRPISEADAFDLYETNWRHVDQIALTQAERQLIAELTATIGRGHFLATR